MSRVRTMIAAGACVCVLSTLLTAQQPPAVSNRSTVIKAAREVMAGARYCALITIGQDGQPQARVVDAFTAEDDMTVWIATKPITRKVAQIRNDPRVTLFYFDSAKGGYVTLLGTAELVASPAEKARHWKAEWKALYKDENRGDDYLLIKVTSRRLEIMSEAHGLVDPKTWLPTIIDLK